MPGKGSRQRRMTERVDVNLEPFPFFVWWYSEDKAGQRCAILKRWAEPSTAEYARHGMCRCLFEDDALIDLPRQALAVCFKRPAVQAFRSRRVLKLKAKYGALTP